MGYMCHHAIVVTSWNEAHIHEVIEKAKEIFPRGVSNIVEGYVNEQYSFFIGPDGSKEGWPDSDEGDARRDEFVTWLSTQSLLYCDWVEVQFGDDYHHTKVIRDSDRWPEE
jgi:hypothetical protein